MSSLPRRVKNQPKSSRGKVEKAHTGHVAPMPRRVAPEDGTGLARKHGGCHAMPSRKRPRSHAGRRGRPRLDKTSSHSTFGSENRPPPQPWAHACRLRSSRRAGNSAASRPADGTAGICTENFLAVKASPELRKAPTSTPCTIQEAETANSTWMRTLRCGQNARPRGRRLRADSRRTHA